VRAQVRAHLHLGARAAAQRRAQAHVLVGRRAVALCWRAPVRSRTLVLVRGVRVGVRLFPPLLLLGRPARGGAERAEMALQQQQRDAVQVVGARHVARLSRRRSGGVPTVRVRGEGAGAGEGEGEG